jgi:hypothetical protein
MSYDIEDGDVNVTQDNIDVYITSMDLENHKIGWAAHMPSISEDKRIPISFADEQDLEQIALVRNYKADVTIIYSRDKKSGDLKPKKAIIIKLGEKLKHGFKEKI